MNTNTANQDTARLAEELHARRRDLDMVMRAVHRLIRYVEPRPLFEAMARIGADALGTDRCSVLLRDVERNVLVYGGSLGLARDIVDQVNEVGLPIDGDLPPSVAVREQRPVQVSNFAELEVDLDPALEGVRSVMSVREGIAAMLYAPIIAEGLCLGLLTIYSREPRVFHPDEVRRLSLLAEICAVAVQNARSHESARQMAEQLAAKALDLQRRNAELHVVADLAPVLAVAGSARQMLSAFHQHTANLAQFEQVALLRLGRDNPAELVIREVYSTSPASFGRGWRARWDGTVADEPMVARKATSHVLSPADVADPICKYALQLGLRSLAFFPLVAGREVLGVLLVGSVREGSLEPAAVATLEPIVAQLAGAMARLEERSAD